MITKHTLKFFQYHGIFAQLKMNTFAAFGKCFHATTTEQLRKDVHYHVKIKMEEYQGQTMYFSHRALGSNEMLMEMKYSTMNIRKHEEYEVQDIYGFIGTVGGSFGLFIGFSYTGFVENLLDYIIRVQNQHA